jgi:uncharacterized protein
VKILVRLLLLILILSTFSGTALAQESLKLVPFTDDTYQIQGVIPDGWHKLSPGIYLRQSSATDTTLIAQQSAPFTGDALMKALLPQLGLSEPPASVGERETETFAWTLYQIDMTQANITVRIDIAVAEKEGKSYLVLLQTNPDEYDALHEQVFLPAVDALSLLMVTEEVPYKVEEVTFKNGSVTLTGTLTMPDKSGRHPAAVLITGSGPQDRDEMVVRGFPIFKLISDDLTRKGIAVLRYDDRGVGKSTGKFEEATSQDFASDAKAAVAYLKSRDDINADQVGVIGHSEGGLITAILGADPNSGIAFIVSVAGPAVSGREVLLLQNRLILVASGLSEEYIDSQIEFLSKAFDLVIERDWEALHKLAYETGLKQWELLSPELRTASGATDAESYATKSADAMQESLGTEWYIYFLKYNPADDWAKTTIPVLALFGTLDLQVDDEQNAPPMEEALTAAGNKDFTIVVLEKANHLFQEAKTGAVSEYFTLDHNFTDKFLPTITDWLLERVDIVE